MKTLKFPNQDEAYEIVDAKAREQIETILTTKTYVDNDTTMPMLTSPNGTKYLLSVNDDGTIATTAVT